jgi:serine-type D-Ala-D-Ala carboxypeptidase/endopeptidase (penicillin-binding protein 4)
MAAILVALAAASPAVGAPGHAYGLFSDSVSFLASGGLRQSEISVLACSLERGDTLVALHAAARMIPGSNAKLFTTGSFLRKYGPDYRRETVVVARGRASGKKGGSDIQFKGDLVLRASGMPDVYQLIAPGSRGLLDSLAYLLRASGLAKFEGILWIDGSVFANEPYGPGWAHDDFSYSYGAAVNAVLANGNAATLIATATPQGVTLVLDPPEVPLTVRGHPTVGEANATPRLDFRRAPGSRVLEVFGVVPRGGTIKRQVAVPDPDSTAALMFLGAMRRAGIEVDAQTRVLSRNGASSEHRAQGLLGTPASTFDSAAALGTPGWASVGRERSVAVVTIDSPTAAEIVGIVNAWSLNAEAEALLRLLDPAPTGKSRERGLAELMRVVSESGVDTLDLSLVDGSGLSPLDLVTARAIVTWLTAIDRDPNLGRAFREGLARPGGYGTLKSRFAALDSTVSLRGKSGTLTNVSALSGYVTGASGDRVVFSMITNGNRSSVAGARDAEERLVTVLGRRRAAVGPVPPPIGIPR